MGLHPPDPQGRSWQTAAAPGAGAAPGPGSSASRSASALLALFVRWLSVDEGLRRRISAQASTPGRRSGGDGRSRSGRLPARVRNGPVLIVLALLAIAIAAWDLSHRARRRRLEPLAEPLVPALADVLEETLDDLRAEADPRRAVIAAYARMERALAAYGLPRNAAEAPDEYLQRIFADLEVSRRATSRLTALFTWAKFSSHDVAPEMKQEAIEALEAVREELRAAEILAEHERAARDRRAARAGGALMRRAWRVTRAARAPDDRARHRARARARPRRARGARLAPRRPRPRARRVHLRRPRRVSDDAVPVRGEPPAAARRRRAARLARPPRARGDDGRLVRVRRALSPAPHARRSSPPGCSRRGAGSTSSGSPIAPTPCSATRSGSSSGPIGRSRRTPRRRDRRGGSRARRRGPGARSDGASGARPSSAAGSSTRSSGRSSASGSSSSSCCSACSPTATSCSRTCRGSRRR